MTKRCFFEKEFVVWELIRYIDVTNLLNSTKLLKRVKNKFIYRKLNKKYSLKYYDNEEFRMIIHDSVENPNKQINLNLNCCEEITDVSALGNVHTLNLFYCDKITDVSNLGKVHTLDLSHCYQITDVSNLGNVHKLIMSKDMQNIKGVDKLKNILYY